LLNLSKGNVAIAPRANRIGRTQQHFMVLLIHSWDRCWQRTHRPPLRRLTTNCFNHRTARTKRRVPRSWICLIWCNEDAEGFDKMSQPSSPGESGARRSTTPSRRLQFAGLCTAVLAQKRESNGDRSGSVGNQAETSAQG